MIAIDINRDALRWQVSKSREMSKESLHAILADGTTLPIKDEAVQIVSCISAIEHIPDKGDIQAAREIGRVLSQKGIAAVSFPLSLHREGFSRCDMASEIPSVAKRVLNAALLLAIFKQFQVDRTVHNFERFYSVADMKKRIIQPSRCELKGIVALRSRGMIKFIYENVIPTGLFTLYEYLIARILTLRMNAEDMDAAILKLRKLSAVD